MSDSPKRVVDWERIECAYRVARQSLRGIAAEHSITEAAIRKRAKRDGWERDLNAKVRATADALVRKALVRSEVRKKSATELEIVAANAITQAEMRLSHRADLSRGRALVAKLFTELEATTDNKDLFEAIGEALFQPDKGGRDRKNELYEAVLAMPGRVKVLKDLTETLATLIGKEREAMGINPGPGEEDPAPVRLPASATTPADGYKWFAALRDGSMLLDGQVIRSEVQSK